MQKQIVKFEINKGKRVYEFFFEANSPLGEIHDALFEMKSFVVGAMERPIQQVTTKTNVQQENEQVKND